VYYNQWKKSNLPVAPDWTPRWKRWYSYCFFVLLGYSSFETIWWYHKSCHKMVI